MADTDPTPESPASGDATSDTPAADSPEPTPADDDASTKAEEPAPRDAGPSEPETSDTTSSLSGTVPAWWTWVGRHRKPVLLVAGVLVVGLVATLVAVSVFTRGPKDVVQSYLDAIRAGDTEEALRIAGEPEEDDRLSFLSGDALADDWSVDKVVERYVTDTGAEVDVTISAGETTQQGRFRLAHDEDGWTIEAPFVEVDLLVGGLDVVELGGVRQPATPDPATATVPVRLFPGVYDLYPSFADRLVFEPSRLVAVPNESRDPAVRFATGYTLTEAGADAAQRAIDAHIDECATRHVLGPPGCPFDAEENRSVERMAEVSDVAWTIVNHPEAHFVVRDTTGLDLVVRKPGTVRLTGTGVPEEGAARTDFALTCEFGLDNMAVSVREDGFDVAGALNGRYSAALSTLCF